MSENDVEKGGMEEEKAVENHDEETKDMLLDEKADAVFTKDGATDPGAVEVKFTAVKSSGLDKEQLMEQCNTPLWKGVRLALLIAFWLSFLAMLVAVIVLISTAPKCPSNQEWYQTGVSYQIFPRSFKDSDGDGHGDLKGIESKVPYLQKLGISAIWLGAIFPSPLEDMGRDVTNFTDVHEDYGTLDDFESLLTKIHSEGLRLIMEFIPNHSSDQHPWFEMSKMSKNNPYSDYYVWEDSPGDKPGQPPSNWLSRYGGPAWTYVADRDQWYLHTFGANEPDLNLRIENVTTEINNALKFWLELGVDGFYIPHANQLIENSNSYRDEQDNIYFKSHVNDTKTPYDKLLHNNTRDQPETHELLAKWRNLLSGYAGPDTDDHRLLVVDASMSSISNQMEYYGSKKKREADYPYNFQLMNLCQGVSLTGTQISSMVQSWLKAKSGARITNWALGDSDHTRVSTRCGRHMLKALNTLMLTLPGSATAYYGDEIGIEDLEIDSSKSFDPSVRVNTRDVSDQISNSTVSENNETLSTSAPDLKPTTTSTPTNDGISYKPSGSPMVVYYNMTRDRFVSPMQWSSDNLGGFSNGSESWAPLNADFATTNVESQENDTNSVLYKFKELIPLVRSEPSLVGGGLREIMVNDKVYYFSRVFDRWPGYLVAINFNEVPYLQELGGISTGLPGSGTVAFSSNSRYTPGENVDFNKLTIDPYEAVVIKFER